MLAHCDQLKPRSLPNMKNSGKCLELRDTSLRKRTSVREWGRNTNRKMIDGARLWIGYVETQAGFLRLCNHLMRPIRLPEPPGGFSGVSDIFVGGVSGAIKRAVVIGNGFAGAENQSIGLVRALGLSGRQSLHVCMWSSVFFFVGWNFIPLFFFFVILSSFHWLLSFQFNLVLRFFFSGLHENDVYFKVQPAQSLWVFDIVHNNDIWCSALQDREEESMSGFIGFQLLCTRNYTMPCGESVANGFNLLWKGEKWCLFLLKQTVVYT